MTGEVQAATGDQAEPMDPMQRAKDGGYVEPEPPSREERISAVVTEMSHAMAHNAPMSPATLAEVKDLLGYVEPVAAPEAEASEAPAA